MGVDVVAMVMLLRSPFVLFKLTESALILNVVNLSLGM
jgi:hypothetical protein